MESIRSTTDLDLLAPLKPSFREQMRHWSTYPDLLSFGFSEMAETETLSLAAEGALEPVDKLNYAGNVIGHGHMKVDAVLDSAYSQSVPRVQALARFAQRVIDAEDMIMNIIAPGSSAQWYKTKSSALRFTLSASVVHAVTNPFEGKTHIFNGGPGDLVYIHDSTLTLGCPRYTTYNFDQVWSLNLSFF